MFSYVPDWVPAIPEWKERLHWSFAAPRTDHLRNVTAVCSQWRKLALGDSRLWSTFWESNSKFATSSSLHISRCPAGPLNVFTQGKNSTRTIELVREHAPRIRQLHCFGHARGILPRDLVLSLFETLKTMDFGLLQHLCLHEPLVPLEEPSALPMVTPMTAATLRSLHLAYRCLPSQSFPSLTRFVFWYPTDLDSPHIGIHSLLRFLAGVPNLEVLHLLRLRIQSGAHDEPAKVARQVELCHLRYFTYDSDPKEVDIPSLTHLLSHIRIPAHCCVHVTKIQMTQNALSDGMQELTMQLLGRRSRRRSTLQFSSRSSRTQAVLVLEIQPEASEDTGGVEICVVFDHGDAAVLQSLDSFLFLSLEQVEECRISIGGNGSMDKTKEIIARIWPKLANVRRVTVSLRWPNDNDEYLGTLHDMLDPLRASSERPPPCPRLETLNIYASVPDPFLEAISQTLASRAEAGFPVVQFDVL